MTTTAEAPSEICEALPAVIEPSRANAGRKPPNDSGVVPGRMPSSVSTRSGSPLRWGTSTGMISRGQQAVLGRPGGPFVRGGREGVLALPGHRRELRQVVLAVQRPWPRGCGRPPGRRTSGRRAGRRRRGGSPGGRRAAGGGPTSWTPCRRPPRSRRRRRRSSGRPGRWR